MKKIFLAAILAVAGTAAYAGELEEMKAESGVKFGETLASPGQVAGNAAAAYEGGQKAAVVKAKASPAAPKKPPIPGSEKTKAPYDKKEAKADSWYGAGFILSGLAFLAVGGTGVGPAIFGAGLVGLGLYALGKSAYFNFKNRKK